MIIDNAQAGCYAVFIHIHQEDIPPVVKIRLMRVGKKGAPQYRIVVADARSPRDGRFIEILGHYNPLTHPSTITFDEAKVTQWLRNGAQPSESVQQLFRTSGFTARLAAAATSTSE